MPSPLPRSRRRAGRLLLMSFLAVFATACVSDSGEREVVSVEESTAARAGAVSFAQIVRDLDGRVDRFVYLRSRVGEEALQERELLASALEAVVVQNEAQLVLTLQEDTLDRQRIAAKALAFSATDAAVAALGETLATSDDPRLLVNAAFALARRQSPRTDASALIRHLDSADGDIRNNVLMALWHTVDARREAGLAPLDPVDHEAALPPVEAALFDPDDPYVRAHAAATLGALGDPRSIDTLINLLRDTHPFVRTHTALALGKIGDPRAVPALVTLIDETPRGTPRSAVVTALAALVEATGGRVPTNLGESEGAWTAFVKQHFGTP